MRRFISYFVFPSLFALSWLPAMAQQDVISTLVGGGPNDIPALQSDLNNPIEVALDKNGNYYFTTCSSTQNRVFKVNASGTLTVVAGAGPSGYGGDGVTGGAANAFLNCPAGIAVDSSLNVYVSDYNNYVVRKINTSTNTITTIAGIGGSRGYTGDGSPATNFELNFPDGLALDASGDLYIADRYNCRVRKLVLSTSTISTYAGTGSCTYGGDTGLAASAHLNYPGGVAIDSAGNIYIADTDDYRIRYVAKSSGNIYTIAGDGVYGFAGDAGQAASAEITYVYEGIAVNAAGTLVTIADYSNYRVRQFTLTGIPNTGTINTVAGTGSPGFSGDGGPALSADLYEPEGVAVTGASVYLADRNNDRIRLFTVSGNPNTGDINTVAGNGSTSTPTLTSGVPPQGVVLDYPSGVYEDPSGNVFVADTYNCLARELVEATDLVNFFAGTGACGYNGDSILATAAELNKTYGVARDSSGNIYIADTLNERVRMVSPSGTITTFAGTGTAGFSGDGGPATSAELDYPYGVAVDNQNNVYIADYYNFRIRKVSNGTITTFAGNGTYGYLGDGDPATTAEFRYPESVATDAAGNLYIADTYNCVIREVSAATGIINTVAGTGTCNFSGDGPAIQNNLDLPSGVWSDANGNLFIADTNNHRIRWVDLSGNMTTVAGDGTGGYAGDGGPAFNAELYYPSGVAQDAAGDILVADQYNFRVRKISAFAGLEYLHRQSGFRASCRWDRSAPRRC